MMRREMKEALRVAVETVLGFSWSVSWGPHEPEYAAAGKVRLAVVGDALQGGSFERVLHRDDGIGKLREEIRWRRLATISVLVEQYDPGGEDAGDVAGRLAAELFRETSAKRLREQGVVLLDIGPLRELPLSADSRVLLSASFDLRIGYTRTDEGRGGVGAFEGDWIEDVIVRAKP